jgi:transcriptional regulator with XRE-family HTH domain
MSQSELAEQSGVPLRTIQQYEQGQKNINRARAEYVIALSKVLYCRPEDLLEEL